MHGRFQFNHPSLYCGVLQTLTMKKEDIITSATILRNDIHKCLSDLVSARLNRDCMQEGGALFRMESLMVSAEQELDCIVDYLKEEEQ